MVHDPVLVANNILNRAFRANIAITPVSLQRILFETDMTYRDLTGSPLFSEAFEPWSSGPVLPSIYSKFSSSSATGIIRFSRNAGGKTLMFDEQSDPYLCASIDRAWERFLEGKQPWSRPWWWDQS